MSTQDSGVGGPPTSAVLDEELDQAIGEESPESPYLDEAAAVSPSPFERPLPRTIAIANQKGGVGKTTTAINLGACLAVAERSTLVVDLDPQGNATSGLGIESARERYEFVLVDCPPSLGLLTLNALAAADAVLIPIQCEFYALEGLSQLLNTVRVVQKNLNPGLQIEGVLQTMYDGRLNLSRQVAEEAKEYFGSRVFRSMIPRNVRLAEAPSFGQPIVLYDVLSVGAKSYLSLAQELIRRVESQKPLLAE